MALYVPLSRVAEAISGKPTSEWVRYFNSLSPPLIRLTTAETSFTPSFLSSNAFAITQTNAIQIENPTNGTPNSTLNIEVFQDSAGGHALTFGSAYIFPGGVPTWSTAPNGRNFITGFYDGTNVLVTGTSAGSGGGGFLNPMTTLGDLIVGNVGGTPDRLGIGGAGTTLFSNGTVASWVNPNAQIALVDAASVAVVTSNSRQTFYLLGTAGVGATRMMANPSGTFPGMNLVFEHQQPVGGGCQVTWDTRYKWGLGGADPAPDVSLVPNASDLFGGVVQNNLDIHMAQIGQSGPRGPASTVPGPVGPPGASSSGALSGASGRLTLTTGVPVTTADVIGASTIYYEPYKGNQIQLWDGTAWTTYTYASTSLTLTGLTASRPYDVFGRQVAGVLTLDFLAWTNNTTRATGVSYQDGRLCKTGDKTRLYLGTFYSTSTTTTEDSGGGTTTQVGGKRFLWNYYNQIARQMTVFDGAATWAYAGAVYQQANAATGNRVEYVNGDVTLLDAAVYALGFSSTSVNAASGVGIDSTTVNSAQQFGGQIPAGTVGVQRAAYSGYPAVGYHAVNWLENSNSASVTWVGAQFPIQTGIIARVLC